MTTGPFVACFVRCRNAGAFDPQLGYFLVNTNKQPALLEKVREGDQQYPAARGETANGGLTWILGES